MVPRICKLISAARTQLSAYNFLKLPLIFILDLIFLQTCFYVDVIVSEICSE
jgi:hypothetical protein